MHGEGYLKFSGGANCKGTFSEDKLALGEMFYENGENYVG